MGEAEFDKWLSERLRELNTDEAVFVPYIKSILEGDESLEEKIEALDGILGELAEADGNLNVEAFRTEIIDGWIQCQKESSDALSNAMDANAEGASELDSKLEKLLKLNDNIPTKNDSLSQGNQKTNNTLAAQVPDSTLRAAILNQCQDSNDSDEDGERPSTTVTSGSSLRASGPGVERNTNAERVQNELKVKRDAEKAEAAKKKEKDKEDRAKQKQQAQDRKDKAKKKASKVERKR